MNYINIAYESFRTTVELNWKGDSFGTGAQKAVIEMNQAKEY